MARKVFYSFHFHNDHWRVQQIRNINVLEGNPPVTVNRWEEIKQEGDAAVRQWINANMSGKSCLIVLVGTETAQRKWVKYEIKKAWEDGRGVLGIYVHGMKDSNGNTTVKGNNPFADVSVDNGGSQGTLGSVPPLKVPGGSTSSEVYASIKDNVENWIEDAIAVRKQYTGAL